MHPFCLLLLTACLLSVSQAVPVAAARPLTRQRSHETLATTAQPSSRPASYRLHSRKLHIAATLGNASDPVWLLGCVAGGMWSVEMRIAEQGPFRLQFDTGSDTLAVLSTLCTSPVECGSELGARLNVSEGVREKRLHGPYGNTSVFYGDETGFVGPLYDASVSLTGQASSLVASITRFVAINVSVHFLDVNLSCPFDSHQLPDFAQGILGTGLGGTTTGQGDSAWLLDYFDQHPDQPRQFTYELCPMDAGRLWMGEYDGDEQFMCSDVVGVAQRWTVQVCGMTLTASNSSSNSNTTSVVLGNMTDFGVCGSLGGDGLDGCGLLDTGTGWVMVPGSVYEPFVAALRSDPAYVGAFGTSGDPFDPSLPFPTAPCVSSTVPIDVLRQQLPTVHIQLSNSSAVDGNGTCHASHTFALPGVDGYLSRFSEPGGSYPLYCAAVVASSSPRGFQHFTVLGDAFMQTHTIRHVLNATASEPSRICLVHGNGCGKSGQHTHSQAS